MSKLLLHTCCAPCALPILDYLIKHEITDIVLYYYNPNIYPKAEYSRRLEEVKKIAKIYKLGIIEGEYCHKKWLRYITESLPQPPANYPENSQRCLVCFSFRLKNTAKLAWQKNFSEFATTLSVNRFKDTEFIDDLGEKLAVKYGIKYRKFFLDPNQAYQVGLQLSRKYNIYRQKYCGCEFSMSKTQNKDLKNYASKTNKKSK